MRLIIMILTSLHQKLHLTSVTKQLLENSGEQRFSLGMYLNGKAHVQHVQDPTFDLQRCEK